MAKKYITGIHRQTVGAGVLSAKKQAGAPRWVQISCRSKEEGQAVMGAISACNPNWTYTKADSDLENILTWGAIPGGSWITGNWKTFRVRTGSSSQSKDLVSDIGQCMEEYGSATGMDVDDGTDSGSGIGKTTIYIIAGVALAAVLAVVITKKRK